MATLLSLLPVLGPSGRVEAQQAPLPRVFLATRQSPTGQEGQHDQRRVMDDLWAEIVRRGAATSAGIAFPTSAQIHHLDVLVLYGDQILELREKQAADFEAYLRRGGGLVVLHNTIESPATARWTPWLGAEWIPGRSRWAGGAVHFIDLAPDHPVTRGLSRFVIAEEMGLDLELSPRAQVLAKGRLREGESFPLVWACDNDGQRTVVILPGHNFASFEHPHFRALLCRAMAWTARFAPDTLLLPEERERYRAPVAPEPPPGAESP